MHDCGRISRLMALGLVCLTGCQQWGQSPSHRRGLSLGGEPTAVTQAQEADMQFTLGRTAERRGDLDQAEAAYNDAIIRDKNRADAYQRLAILHDRRSDFGKSSELYEKALVADPGNADIYCDMGYSLYLQRRWAESERNLKQAIALRPDHARAHNNLGLVLAHNHRNEEALAEYRKAGNDEAKARSNLALALSLDGRMDEARSQYQKVLALAPADPSAHSRLKEIDALVARNAPQSATSRDPQIIKTSATAAPAKPARR
jgi:tetratricopeptide (TPR) repeat protein